MKKLFTLSGVEGRWQLLCKDGKTALFIAKILKKS